jgi:peptidoglycan/xylan/chitin deacetylase (PgdA/CDA1 family)
MSLYSSNTFHRFWGLPGTASLPGKVISELAGHYFPNMPQPVPADWENFIALLLGEGQFGAGHFRIKGVRSVYYQLRPFLPAWFRPWLHRIASSHQKKESLLSWPAEERYAKFQFGLMRAYMDIHQKKELQFLHFWPLRKRIAFVITHDVEGRQGLEFIPELLDLEERYNFRSSFNFVPAGYHLDPKLLDEVNNRGFEVGVHGLKHDGRDFLSASTFFKRVLKINEFLHEWHAAGFRAPLTHRNPEWMQALDIEYDSSFFDTDPYEPIPGGTMSLWPFHLGKFIELPYTLVQDHTLMNTLGEKTPRIWMEKVAVIRRYCGLALVNVHPDYLRMGTNFAVYEDFLRQMSQARDTWCALPRDVARWWKERSETSLNGSQWDLGVPAGACLGTLRSAGDGIEVEV